MRLQWKKPSDWYRSNERVDNKRHDDRVAQSPSTRHTSARQNRDTLRDHTLETNSRQNGSTIVTQPSSRLKHGRQQTSLDEKPNHRETTSFTNKSMPHRSKTVDYCENKKPNGTNHRHHGTVSVHRELSRKEKAESPESSSSSANVKSTDSGKLSKKVITKKMNNEVSDTEDVTQQINNSTSKPTVTITTYDDDKVDGNKGNTEKLI